MHIILPKRVKMILDRFWENGFEGYIVGGCVRDFCLGKEPQDYDITTSALPEETKEIFSEFPIIETGIRHGTITVMIDSKPFEITTYRIDGAYQDHRHPDQVVFTASLREDLKRRDFTVNAMAYYDELVDCFDGLKDIEKKRIRCVGDPDTRFEEDGLRILRALRFSSVLGFSIEDATAKSLREKKDLLCAVSKERIQMEWNKLLSGEDAEYLLFDFQDVIQVFFKEFKPCHFSDAQNDSIVRLVMLLNKTYEKNDDKASLFLKELKYSNEIKNAVKLLLATMQQPFFNEKVFIKRYLNQMGKELTIKAAMLQGIDISQTLHQIEENRECWSLEDLCINGDDLIHLGYASGKQIGEKLKFLLDIVIQEPWKNTVEGLKEFL